MSDIKPYTQSELETAGWQFSQAPYTPDAGVTTIDLSDPDYAGKVVDAETSLEDGQYPLMVISDGGMNYFVTRVYKNGQSFTFDTAPTYSRDENGSESLSIKSWVDNNGTGELTLVDDKLTTTFIMSREFINNINEAYSSFEEFAEHYGLDMTKEDFYEIGVGDLFKSTNASGWYGVGTVLTSGYDVDSYSICVMFSGTAAQKPLFVEIQVATHDDAFPMVIVASSRLGDIEDSSVTADKLASNSVTTDNIASSAVTTTKLGTGAVATSKIGDQQVTNVKIATNAVDGRTISDQSVTTGKIALKSIVYGHLSDDLKSRIFNQLELNNLPQVGTKEYTYEEFQSYFGRPVEDDVTEKIAPYTIWADIYGGYYGFCTSTTRVYEDADESFPYSALMLVWEFNLPGTNGSFSVCRSYVYINQSQLKVRIITEVVKEIAW